MPTHDFNTLKLTKNHAGSKFGKFGHKKKRKNYSSSLLPKAIKFSSFTLKQGISV